MKDQNSINSFEGWQAAANAANKNAFIITHGREPQGTELKEWVNFLHEWAERDIDRTYVDRHLIKGAELQECDFQIW